MPPRNLWELLINVKVALLWKMVKTHVLQLLDGGFVSSFWRFQNAGGLRLPGHLAAVCVCSLQKGTYLPQTYIIHEEMVVTGQVHNLRQLGPFIYQMCHGKDTYRLSRRVSHRRECGKVIIV